MFGSLDKKLLSKNTLNLFFEFGLVRREAAGVDRGPCGSLLGNRFVRIFLRR